MPTVKDLLGPHAYWLLKYGISPKDGVETAVFELRGAVPHLAKLLCGIAAHHQQAVAACMPKDRSFCLP